MQQCLSTSSASGANPDQPARQPAGQAQTSTSEPPWPPAPAGRRLPCSAHLPQVDRDI